MKQGIIKNSNLLKSSIFPREYENNNTKNQGDVKNAEMWNTTKAARRMLARGEVSRALTTLS